MQALSVSDTTLLSAEIGMQNYDFGNPEWIINFNFIRLSAILDLNFKFQ